MYDRLFEDKAEANNEIKSAVSALRTVIRKYADKGGKQEMIDALNGIEKDLKAMAKAAIAKGKGKKMNEAAGAGVDEDTAYETCNEYFLSRWLDSDVDPDDLESAFRAGFNGADIPTEYGDLYVGKDWDYYENAYDLGVTFSGFATQRDMLAYCLN